MNKQKFGKLFYYATLVIVIIALIAALFVFRSDGSEEMNLSVSIIRYAIAYFSFATVLSCGIIVNEYCSGKFVKNKLITKIILSVVTTIVGALVYLFVKSAVVASGMFFVAIICLIYVLTPTVKNETKKI